jgi:hypothetical protein
MNEYRFPGVAGVLGPAGLSHLGREDVLRLHRGLGPHLENACRAPTEAGALASMALVDARIAEAQDGYQWGYEGADSSRRVGPLTWVVPQAKAVRNYVVGQLGLPLSPL